MPYVQSHEWYPIPNIYTPIRAQKDAEMPFVDPHLIARMAEQEWTDFDDVTRKSELERIYPSWIGWTSMAALLIAIFGVMELVLGLLVRVAAMSLIGAILFTIGAMAFLLVTRVAARIRFGAAGHSASS